MITTLAIVVIVSAMLLALLAMARLDRQATFSYGASIRAGELALGALQEITGGVLGEIVAGSTTTVSGEVRVFVPLNHHAAAPARVGFAAADYTTGTDFSEKLPATLRQVSRRDTRAYYADSAAGYDLDRVTDPGASSVSSAAPAVGGHAISPARWNTPRLMRADSRPPAVFAEHPPDWIYITRAGAQNLDGEAPGTLVADHAGRNPNAVLGRYAFVLYDTGGLLDAGVAGWPMRTFTGTAALRGKSSVAYADLTRLPGLAGDDGQEFAEEFVRWRNAGGLKRADVQDDYAKLVAVSASTGFLRAELGDNPLLGRRDLLDYLHLKNATAAAPYLGTFTRAVSAPSWRPDFNAENPTPARPHNVNPQLYRYADQADRDGGVNRDLANVRHPRDAELTHYTDSGTALAYAVKRGEPLLMTRFSLARLAWLHNNPRTGTGPDTSWSAAIQQCFGLRWDYPGGNANTAANGGHRCWNYVGAGNDGFPGKIKTLAEVAAEGREPDFFELLKAAILHGSLGRAPGKASFDNGIYSKTGYGSSSAYSPHFHGGQHANGPAGLYCLNLDPFNPDATVPAPAQIPDRQIIQIGANIIDQYDADSYPTAIYFRYDGCGSFDSAGAGSMFFGPVCMVFGDENLPCLSRVAAILASPTRGDAAKQNGEPCAWPGDKDTDTIGGWIQPELWNPHQEPLTVPEPPPDHFQIRAYGSAYTRWSWNASGTKVGRDYTTGRSDNVEWYQTNDQTEFNAVGTIDVRDRAATSSFYRSPFLVRNDPDAYPLVTATSAAEINLSKKSYVGISQNPFVAFSTGTTSPEDHGGDFRPFYFNATSAADATQGAYQERFDSDGTQAASFVLGWVDANGGFHPYSFLTGVFVREGSAVADFSGYLGRARTTRADDRWAVCDPRTARFSVSAQYALGGGDNNHSEWWRSADATTRAAQRNIPMHADFGFHTIANPANPYGYTQDFMANTGSAGPAPFGGAYYQDPDGVTRPGDGCHANPAATDDGLMLSEELGRATYPQSPDGDRGVNSDQRHGRRPVILNRPFENVGELGYVFRDLPFKTLDFFSTVSADAALLDVFTVSGEARVVNRKIIATVSGRFNPNHAPVPVIEAVLAGAAKKDAGGANCDLAADDASRVAQNIVAHLQADGPLGNRADLVTVLSGTIRAGFDAADTGGRRNKAYFEAPVRALVTVSDFRTWNLMLDVIAQAGRIAPNAASLADFIVEGERRYWLHLAIDRYTGQIIAQQLEPVYE
ncbi:MAG: hypothetical protein LBK60_11995 [Verrucomicrobiales bacterium]|nr:hypothetical protein [Verrucomicrobiales bacterium]